MQKKSQRQERVAEIEESWKSYNCFSADYLKKKKSRRASMLHRQTLRSNH